MTETESPYMTRRETAAFLRVQPHTVDAHARAGRLTKHKVGGTTTTLYLRAEVQALVAPVASAAPAVEGAQ